jgi:hypothetical protein
MNRHARRNRMTRTKNQTNNATPGFSLRHTDQTDLGIATLIAEDDRGAYHLIGMVGTIAEGREVASRDMDDRMKQLENGGEPFCPVVYKVWARGLDGFAVGAEFDVSEL